MEINISDIRKEYTRKKLRIQDVYDDPIHQFEEWLKEAIVSEVPEPTAMCLSTVNESGQPSSRMLLLKGIINGNFLFYTNYNSQKAMELLINPKCSITFFWPELERQVNISGLAEKTDAVTSDGYFSTRPYTSQVGAWASPQSEPVFSRITILKNFLLYAARFAGRPIPRPPHWGGFALKPEIINFWQGRPSRLHDRIRFSLNNQVWTKVRIAP